MLLVITGISAAVLALPALASAGEWEIDSENGALPTFTSTGGITAMTSYGFGSFFPIECTKSTSSGKYTSRTTAVVTVTFTGCLEGGFPCTTSGQSSETIKTTELVAHNIMIESTSQVLGGTPGLLITPNSGHFATFDCGSFHFVIAGNGIIGYISAPRCGAAFQKVGGVVFRRVSEGIQHYKQVTTTGTLFDLSTTDSIGTFTTAWDSAWTLTFNQGVKATCP
jgi:hypothetical protein